MTDKKLGRPTDDPKIHQTRIRMTENEWLQLEYCATKLGITKTDVVNLGIEKVYRELAGE